MYTLSQGSASYMLTGRDRVKPRVPSEHLVFFPERPVTFVNTRSTDVYCVQTSVIFVYTRSTDIYIVFRPR
jgi:hypothetical protein